MSDRASSPGGLSAIRRPATALYAFCRLADDAIDEGPGDAATVAARMAAEIRAATACHCLLQTHVGDMPLGTALRSITAWQEKVRPLLEGEFGPLEQVGMPAAAAA